MNKRKTVSRLYYSDKTHPRRFLDEKRREAPAGAMMSGAQRASTDSATNAAVPSDSDVADMRRFSEENRL